MALGRSNAAEGEESEILIFINEAGKPLRIAGNKVDMSNFFTDIGCYGDDGTVLPEPCPCGVDVDGNIIEQVAQTNDDGSPELDPDTGEQRLSCPITDDDSPEGPKKVEKNPVAFVNVSQVGDFDVLKVSYRQDAKVKGCVEGYVQRREIVDPATNAHAAVDWERYCTKAAQGVDQSVAGENFANDSFADASGTATGEEMTIYLNAIGPQNADYPIKDGITISENDAESPRITMLIDTSTFLRYHISDNIENRKHNEFQNIEGSFFYVRQFSAQNFVFVGEPGSFRRYDLRMNLKANDDQNSLTPAGSATNPAAYDECVLTNDDCIFVGKGKLSLIYEKDGTPLLFNLAVTHGNAWDTANQSKDGILASAISADSTASGTYRYILDNVDGNNDRIETSIYQLGLDVDVDASFTAYTHYIHRKSDGEVRGHSWGRITATRDY